VLVLLLVDTLPAVVLMVANHMLSVLDLITSALAVVVTVILAASVVVPLDGVVDLDQTGRLEIHIADGSVISLLVNTVNHVLIVTLLVSLVANTGATLVHTTRWTAKSVVTGV
jgi:predicted permease